jgi:hypothetical protein
VCRHFERETIDSALVAGESLRTLAARVGLSPSAIRRHKTAHLPATLVRATEAAEVATADDLLRQVMTLHREALGVLARAKEEQDGRLVLAAVGRACRTLELQARMFVQLRAEIEATAPNPPTRYVAIWGTEDGYCGPNDPQRPGGADFDPERHAIVQAHIARRGSNHPRWRG